MSDEDKIEIEGKESKIKIEGGKDIEIEGDKNVIEIDAGEKDVEIEGDKNVIEIDAGEKEKKPKKDHIEIDKKKIKKGFGAAVNFFKNKKVQNILLIVLLIAIVVFGALMRTQNLNLLIDQTTGEYIPTALDPFYFLRMAETIIEQGSLPNFDIMRYPSANLGFTHEILPQASVFMYNVWKIFDNDATIQFVNVISPVIFFALGIIVFFFLIYFLTKSKVMALISSAFLAFIPPYLYRTLAGFSDHEAIGIFAFFLVILGYGLCLKFLEKGKGTSLIKSILLGLIVGFLSAFAIASWGGGANFIFMIIPLSFGLLWLIKSKNLEATNKKYLRNLLIFYCSWFIFSILSGLIYGFSFVQMFSKVLLRPSSLISGAVLLFTLVDFSLIRFKNKIKFIKKERLEKYRVLYSLLIVAILGLIFLILQGNLFSSISNVLDRFIHPFGAGRTGLTVAENKQPFLEDWINQVGKIFFWFFYLGMLFVGFNLSKGINKKGHKILFSLFWVAMISGILFSRISPSSLFNGTNFISKFIYFGSLILFFGYFLWLYFKEKINIKSELLIIFSWLLFMIIAGRGAVRLLFMITPFAAFMGGYFLVNLFNCRKKSKDDLFKMVLGIILIISLIGALFSFNTFINITNVQAKSTGPSAGSQWQSAMSWVRDNTAENSIFVHWWDYGYWVQYLGERPTITDGGHGIGYWDHLIGRYLLTTPEPEPALSFMKSHNVSHLLIDPTDLGKYGAYSIIGSDEEGDRLSHIPVMLSNPDQIQKIEDKERRVYQGGALIDEDIIYDQGGQKIFLPAKKAIVAAVITEFSKNGEVFSFSEPYAIFVYNNQQITIPIRYLYFNEKIIDFGGGLDAIIRIIPSASFTGQNVQLDEVGALIYLSPRVSKSLFSQLYLMDDPFNKYPTLRAVHSQHDGLVKNLKFQGANVKDFVFFNGFRGPIKIWEVNYPNNIVVREEFLRTSGEYAEFDNLKFTI